ncbi:uncharacterized protein MELLADRAFT_110449 [Melampsora larici-populina 98AG31]|uniref:SWIM-type domain-containing protein n=1 Tax=Melampsora larici-populina (strain 98AG31 / pathotype 3-4-7) TaxID=747676 RepID=F4RZU8_MELLP|nr:uncharacterized protein MELLADRAFT_110449 [Melampsora larici-populina 98AG31]EGG02125.1 hypothetical protein MELLADRAFT_110449 [Melampsora larici-populina 98AG31]
MPTDDSHSDYSYQDEFTSYQPTHPTGRSDATPSRWPVHPQWDPEHDGPFPAPPHQRGGEKRKARWRPKCSVKVRERLHRVMTQKLWLAGRDRVGPLCEKFGVLGNTGNLYNLVVDQSPRCDCPDWLNGYVCKHLLFVFIKVLGVSPKLPWYFQKALLSTEVENIFSTAPEAPVVPTSALVRSIYADVKSQSKASGDLASRRKPIGEEDDCPICYDKLLSEPAQDLMFCDKVCGNSWHAECHHKYAKHLNLQGKNMICVYCRSDLKMPVSRVAGTRITGDGRINLAAAVGIPYMYSGPYVPPHNNFLLHSVSLSGLS